MLEIDELLIKKIQVGQVCGFIGNIRDMFVGIGLIKGGRLCFRFFLSLLALGATISCLCQGSFTFCLSGQCQKLN